MTREEKIEAYAMRLDGHTLQEIGDKFGVTREYIRLIVGIRGNVRPPKNCVYPAIGKWFSEHGASLHGFAKEYGVCLTTINNVLTGKTDPSKKTIDKILTATGMTYEEAFRQ